MYSAGATIAAGITAVLILGFGLGFHLGKLYGMKLGIAARDFAESFGIGQNAMQAGVGLGQGYTAPSNPPWAALGSKSIVSIGGGGGGGSGSIPYSVGGGGGGSSQNLTELYKLAISSGMTPADANKLIGAEMQRRQEQAMYTAALRAQKQTP